MLSQNRPTYLWNPATKQSMCFPRHNINVNRLSSHGFGFDPVASDYKVFRIGCPNNSQAQVEIYSSNADSWRETHIDIQLGVKSICFVGIVEGVPYWEAGHELMSFDMHHDVFR